MGESSGAVLSLQPVTFRYKKELDPSGDAQFGLVAEDVAMVAPELVVRDEQGKPLSVRYDEVNAMLLNEFLKEHKKVEAQSAQLEAAESELHATKSQLQVQGKEITELKAALKEQAAQLQKVSARLEANTSATRLVDNP